MSKLLLIVSLVLGLFSSFMSSQVLIHNGIEYTWVSWALHMFIIMVDCYILGKIAK
mgnify:FL=1